MTRPEKGRLTCDGVGRAAFGTISLPAQLLMMLADLPVARRLPAAGADKEDPVRSARAVAYEAVFTTLDELDSGSDVNVPGIDVGWLVMESAERTGGSSPGAGPAAHPDALAARGSEGISRQAASRQITAAFSAADERLGGGHGLTTVTAYLADTAAPMLRGRFPSEALRRAAFGAVAELAYLAGWKHHDLGQEGAAQRYYQVGYKLACEADPHGHAAWMMRALAHQALSLKQPHHCVDLVEGALRTGLGHVDGQTEALLHITHARAYAATDEHPSAARALLAAEDALLRDDGPQPSYSRVSGPAAGTVASHTARTLTDLADHIGTEQQHRDALTRWDPEKYKRVHALTHADLGDSLAAQARADEAVAAWTQALVLMEGMTSDRTRKAITSIRSTLAVYQRRKVPGAADLARRAREALA